MKFKKLINEGLNTEIEEKARETVNPVYADAMRRMKDDDKKREKATKLSSDTIAKEPEPVKNELLKKMYLSESLFNNEEDLKPLTDEERDYLDYLRKKEKVTSLDKEELWELMGLEEREDLIDDEDWDEEDDLDESLNEKKTDYLNLYSELEDKLNSRGYTLYAPDSNNRAKVMQKIKSRDGKILKFNYDKAKSLLDNYNITYKLIDNEKYKKPFIEIQFKEEDLA